MPPSNASHSSDSMKIPRLEKPRHLQVDKKSSSTSAAHTGMNGNVDHSTVPHPELNVVVEAGDSSTPPTGEGSKVSDGGKEAWMTILGCWILQFCTIGYSNAFGVYQDFYTRDFLSNKSPSDISWIGSFQLFMQYAPGILVGHTFDAGYFRFMIALGSLLEVFSLLVLSLAHRGQYYQVFLAQAVGLGLGQSLLFIPSLAIIPRHFKERRAFATGVAVTGASLGGIIWPILLNQLSGRTSFANAIRVTGGLAGAMLCCANLIMKPGSSPSQSSSVARTASTSAGNETPQPGGMRSILRDRAFMVSIAAACFVAFGLFFPYFYLQLYALDKGLDSNFAFYIIAILSAGSIVGRLLPNFFADRLGSFNLIVPCLAATSILLFAMLGVNTSTGLVIFGLLYGCISGSYLSLIPSIIAQLSKNSGQPGLRMGFAFTNVGFCMLLGTPIEGALLHATSDRGFIWTRTIVFSGVIVMGGAMGMLVSRSLHIRARGNGTRRQWV